MPAIQANITPAAAQKPVVHPFSPSAQQNVTIIYASVAAVKRKKDKQRTGSVVYGYRVKFYGSHKITRGFD